MSDSPAAREFELDFSVLVSCYFEEKSIDEFYTRLSTTLENTGRSYEIIFVNDGSTDATYAKLETIYDKDPNVTAIFDLFRNTGQANAKTPALLVARGRGLILIDSDLQLDPEELPRLIEEFDKGAHIVSGYRSERHDSFMRRLPSAIANIIMRKASSSTIRDFGCTFKIYDHKLVNAFNFGPFNPWRIVPVIGAAGKVVEVPVTHHARKYGQSGWTFRKLFAYNMENIVNLSKIPFQVLGATCLCAAALFIFRILIAYVYPFSVLSKVTNGLVLNVLVAVCLILLTVLSVIGELVIRNFGRLQQRPAYAVRCCRLRHQSNPADGNES